MRKAMLTVAVTVTALSMNTPSDRAGAMPFGNPAGVGAAANDVSVAERVHCVRGNPHHRMGHGRWSDGCSGPAFDSIDIPVGLFFSRSRSSTNSDNTTRVGNPNRGVTQGGANPNRGASKNPAPGGMDDLNKIIGGSRIKF